jgi:hypothetical protein
MSVKISQVKAPKFKFSAFALTHKGKKDNYPTPKKLYKELDSEFHFDYDPCPLNPEGLREIDGLGDWGGSNYVNPPYSNKTPWIRKAIEQQKKGKLTVMLVPADTSTNWFHDLLVPNCEIRFIKGRVSFNGRTHASFPTMICIFRPKANPSSEGKEGKA